MQESQDNLPLRCPWGRAKRGLPALRCPPGSSEAGAAAATRAREVVARGVTTPESSGSDVRSTPRTQRPGWNETRKSRAGEGVGGWGRWQEAEDQKVAEKAA